MTLPDMTTVERAQFSGDSDVAAYHSQVAERIRDLEEQIRALKTSHNSVTATCRIPIEILTIIFSFISHLPSIGEVLNISHICRHWRMVALESPHLWTCFQGNCLLKRELMHTMLERAKGASLTVIWEGGNGYLYDEETMDEDLVAGLLSRVDRLESVVLSGNTSQLVRFSSLLPEWPEGHAPLLKKLCLANVVIVDDDYFPSELGQPEPDDLAGSHLTDRLLQGGAPVLYDLTLSHLGIAWANVPLGDSLVHLRLLEEPGFGEFFRPTTPAFIHSLREMARLENLELHGVLPRGDSSPAHPYTFPSTLKTLKLTDSSDYLSHFLRIARVLDHVGVTVTFLQEDIDTGIIGGVLSNLKSSLGNKRANTKVRRFIDQAMSTRFELCFDESESPPEALSVSEGHLGKLAILGCLGNTPCLQPHDYYSVIAQHFDLSQVRSVQFAETELAHYEEQAWFRFRHLPLLESVTLLNSNFSPLVNQLESDPILSTTPHGQMFGKRCYFPVLKTIICVSSRFCGIEDRDLKHCMGPLAKVLRARKQLGVPLPTIHFNEEEIGEEEIVRLREAVPGLSVYRSAQTSGFGAD